MIKRTALVLLLGTFSGFMYSQYTEPSDLMSQSQGNSYNISADMTSAWIIPEDRRIDWTPGIPGGIPEITGPTENILDHGADPTGTIDNSTAILNAINTLPTSGGVVYIPEGTYRFGSRISIERDNIVLRGDGPISKLLIGSNGNCIEIGSNSRETWQRLPEAVVKGSISITVKDGSVFAPGQFAEIEQDNDSVLMYTDPEWNQRWAQNSVGQFFEVVSVQGNEIRFKAPANYTFSADLNSRIRPMELLRNIGLEDLYIEKTVARGHTIAYRNTAYCWIRGIESNHTRRSHVNITSSLGHEIRESYFHSSFSYGGGGSGYGVECNNHATNNLIENNIFDSLRHAMLVQVGSNGNVFGYNYSINTVQGDGETNLNIGWMPPDISIHGHYTFMNLFEGNEVEEIGIADWWGPAGPGNTFFRNKVNGEGIFYYDESHYQNVIGNITTSIRDEENRSKYKLEHGNVVNNKTLWDPDISNHYLPDSYYLDSVPSFFQNASWPSFGPDIQGRNKLPAQVRFENIK